jgi:hypothetical protein
MLASGSYHRAIPKTSVNRMSKSTFSGPGFQPFSEWTNGRVFGMGDIQRLSRLVGIGAAKRQASLPTVLASLRLSFVPRLMRLDCNPSSRFECAPEPLAIFDNQRWRCTPRTTKEFGQRQGHKLHRWRSDRKARRQQAIWRLGEARTQYEGIGCSRSLHSRIVPFWDCSGVSIGTVPAREASEKMGPAMRYEVPIGLPDQRDLSNILRSPRRHKGGRSV